MKSISITDLRSNLKDILSDVKEGQVIQITQRGRVIATVNPAIDSDDEFAFQERIAAYKDNGIQINEDIINSPLKSYDYVDDSLFSTSIAAEPNE